MITARPKRSGARYAFGLAIVAGLLGAPGCTRRHSDGALPTPDAGPDAAAAGQSAARRDAGTASDAEVLREGGSGSGSVRDAGVRQERCCVDQRLQSCPCPSGVCNFLLTAAFCTDGTCRVAGDPPCDNRLDCIFDALDYAESKPLGTDAGLGWRECCLGGRQRLCFQPPNEECHYDRGVVFNDDGTCEFRDIVDFDAGP